MELEVAGIMALFSRKEKSLPLFLDLGSNSIKWIEAKPGREGPIIEKLGVVRTPTGSIRDGFISDNKAIAQTISKILAERKLKEKTCITALSGLQVVAKLVKLPPMEEEEVRQALQYQAENYIPYPADQVVMDIHILGEVTEGESRKVVALLAAAQKETVYSLVEVLEEAGLKVKALEMAPLVLLRSLLETKPQLNGDHVLSLHVGASSSAISVISNRRLRFCRIVPISGSHLTKALVNTLRLDFEDAERTKKKMGAAFIDAESEAQDMALIKQLRNIMMPTLGSLLNEIQRSVAYYESKYRREQIQKLLLTGASAKLKGLDRYLEEELGIPVEMPSPFSGMEVKAEVSQEYLQSVAPVFHVCAGLVLRELDEQMPKEKLSPVSIDTDFEFGSSRQAGL